MNSNVQKQAYECTNQIKPGLSDYLTAASSSMTTEAQQELTVESLLKVMEEIGSDLENRNTLVPPRREDIKIDLHRDKYYKVEYKDQLQSIEFITGVEEIETKTVRATSEYEARCEAEEILNSSATILKIEFSHEAVDRSRVNVEYMFRPVIPINRIVANFMVGV